MKLPMTCMKCLQEQGYPNFNFKNVEIKDNGIYEMLCEKGHKTVTILQNEKFEILFDMGVLAFREGYKQEAVCCLTVAMERFHEWCILVFLTNNKVKFEDYEKTWNFVSKQSERQLGAFYFLYLKEFKKVPPTINKMKGNKDVASFRNKVIHNGYIPKYEEVLEFGHLLFDYIGNILSDIKHKYPDSIKSITSYRITNFHNSCKKEYDLIPTMCQNTMLGLYNGVERPISFEEGMNALCKQQSMINDLLKISDLTLKNNKYKEE